MNSLLYFLLKKNGRNNKGKITVRHKGGGHKRLYRIINFSYAQLGVPKNILTLDYNPNRTSKLLLTKNVNGIFEYYLAYQGVSLNKSINYGPNFENESGFAKPLWNMPIGSEIYNVELVTRKGAQIARSAGVFCVLIALHKSFAIIKLPSKEIRLIKKNCFGSLGRVFNNLKYLINKHKAGKNRWFGIRPSVRGVAMNPIDHPHGGGEGRCPVGHKSQLTPWGKPAYGLKTRKKPNKFFISKKKD